MRPVRRSVARGLPVVAVVGRPNVGKSSLVNRVLGRREAIVQEQPGVTRDRASFVADWEGREFELVDTGGLEAGADGLDGRVAEQARLAIDVADVIVLVVDAAAGPIQDDLEVADLLRRSNKPVLVAANKVDDPADEPMASAFYRLGLGEPRPLSALHGRGSGDFLAALIELLPEETRGDSSAWASIAIVGRPNVGKSSLLNMLMGEERALVDEVPGTTRDPVDSFLELGGDRRLRIVDTAGMRRRVQIEDPVEYFSLLRSRQTLRRVDAAVLIVDAEDGVTSHDQHLANEILEHGRACVVAINKWDRVPQDPADRARFDDALSDKLRFLPWASTIRTCALTGRGVDRILPAVVTAVESHRKRLPTPAVNRIVRAAQEARPHPRVGGRPVRILYAVQAGTGPPEFVIFATQMLESAYVRYLERALREAEEFPGCPLKLRVRTRSRREAKV